MILLKYIGLVLLVLILFAIVILIYFYITNMTNSQQNITTRKGIVVPDDVIFIQVPINQWTEATKIRILVYIVDEPYAYLYRAYFVINEIYVYKLDDIWVEKETKQETEYSKFIGLAIDNYLLNRKNNP